MFQLLQPIWLFGLTALAAPIIIHLWNRKPGKTLKVGSIALIKESSRVYKKQVSLSQLLLLLVRCLLLACIALALSGPIWRKAQQPASKGWVLTGRHQLPATYNRFKPMIDSLLKAGFEFHYFEAGFAQAKLADTVTAKSATAAEKKLFYRRTAALLNEAVSPNLPVYIFTDNYLRNFSGERFSAPINLRWFTYTPDTSRTQKVIDSSSLYVTIYSKPGLQDAHYVQAALEAVQQFSQKKLIIKTVTAPETIPPGQDWLFCLDEQLPNAVNAKNTLLYAKGAVDKTASYIIPLAGPLFTPIALYAFIIKADTARWPGETRWHDGFGHPLLTVEPKNNGFYYRLYTHFDPAWNELPWSDDFAGILYQLLYTNRASGQKNIDGDKTILDSAQLVPLAVTPGQAAISALKFNTVNLTNWCWILAFVLFFAERSLSFYYLKKMAYD